ncbi:uncharacterized protein LOC114731846 [Neltuma alba]|uniref:uncharacterized protein LOC114731846 n=1 Tax=Neltuma alba TaxID=207710 RepID=UPI0010A4443E|nr:uncharacterized protein LOC114731846 [Prosopis alba]
MALLSKNKLALIDGSLTPPKSDDALFHAWDRCNNLEDIYSLRQGSLSVSEYYTRLKILWDELDNIRPLKPCSCTSADTALHHREQDRIIRFLKGLNDSYGSIKSQIMLIDPLPSINRVFSLVIQQERELTTPLDSKILITKGPPLSSRPAPVGPKPTASVTKQCSYCGRPRHTEAICYRKHGFPPGFKFRSPATVNSITTQDSGNVQETHTAASLPVSSSSTASILPHLTSEQYQRLLTLLTPQQPSASVNHFTASAKSPKGILNSSLHSVPWIIDSGATDHVCSNLDLFSSYHSISPVSVSLPTGTQAVSTISGTVVISSSLVLTNVEIGRDPVYIECPSIVEVTEETRVDQHASDKESAFQLASLRLTLSITS